MGTGRRNEAEVAVIGAGIVGLATAYQVTQREPGRRVIVLDKEPQAAQHQTGRNSGVLHSGIYYKPGSLKAVNCRTGKRSMEQFCESQGIPYEVCGKVIVAVDQRELPAMERLYERGQQNGVRCELIGPEQLAELEPQAAGVRAIHVPETGIVNYRRVCERLVEIIRERGGEVVFSAKVCGLRQSSHGSGRADADWRVRGQGGSQLRRAAVRPHYPYEWPAGGGEDRALSRGILRVEAGSPSPLPEPDLSCAGPELSISGSALHADDRRRGASAARTPCWLCREGYRKRDVTRSIWRRP